MVNLGRPSRGCAVCRKRRIKCNEASPSCSYCIKRQLVCPGYKSDFDIAWKDQNLVAERSVQRRKKASEKADIKDLAIKQLSKSPSPTISGGLTEDRMDYAVKFFLSSYVILPEQVEMQRGILDCLYPIWVEASPDSPLKIAVASVSCYLLEAWSQLDPAKSPVSTSLYLRGVASLRRIIESSREVDGDVLMAALMLQMYENLRAFKNSQFSADLHVSGATALICQQKRLFADQASQRLLLGIRNQIVGRALKNSVAIPTAVATWADLTSDVPKRPAHQLDEINMDVANFQAVVSGLGNDASTQAGLISSLWNTAMQLDQRLIAWLNMVPTWIPIRVPGPQCNLQGVRDIEAYQDYCDVYRSVFVADQINLQRCSRIKIHLSILTCLHILDTENRDSLSAISRSVIQELADDICACVPYHLGNRVHFTRLDDKSVKYPQNAEVLVPYNHHSEAAAFAGWFLSARLVELLSPRLPLRDGQQQWIGEQMQRLKRLYAIQEQEKDGYQ